MITVLTDAGQVDAPRAEAVGQALWLDAADAVAITGWALKPEGFCRGPVCVPLPTGDERQMVQGKRIDVAALWRHLGKPVVRSDRGDVWVLGEGAADRAAALASLEAPDFTLPDVAGRPHSLSEQRGKKVLLVTWASW
jgi:hypothetical protein